MTSQRAQRRLFNANPDRDRKGGRKDDIADDILRDHSCGTGIRRNSRDCSHRGDDGLRPSRNRK